VRAEIPAVLATAHKAPYTVPADSGCAALAAEDQALDAALGTDLDTPAAPSNPDLVERSGDAATDVVRGAAEGVVPLRSWIRKLSGAERYAKEVAAAIAAGSIRRGFLKGLGQAAGCPAPAAPRRAINRDQPRPARSQVRVQGATMRHRACLCLRCSDFGRTVALSARALTSDLYPRAQLDHGIVG